MLEVNTIADLDKLCDQDCAVVFIWVDWSMHARQSASIAIRMVADWRSKHPDANIDLLQIDLSEQSGEMWDAVEQWLGSQDIQDAGSLMYGGAGALLWVRSGMIVQYVVNASSEAAESLAALTWQAFSEVG